MSIYDKSSLVLIPSGTKTGKVYSQKPVSGDGDFTFTRSSAATRVNADGFIEKETSNLLLQSNQFDTTWSPSSSISVTGGQSGYDGSSNAWLIKRSDASARYINQSLSLGQGVYTYSVYAKAESVDWLFMWTYDGNGSRSRYFDLANGVVGATIDGTIDVDIESVGNGWYRCSITYDDSIIAVRLYPAVADGSITGGVSPAGIYIQDAQLNQGLIAQEVITTTTSAVEGGITDNVPRLDYTDSSCPALLLEPQRTNDFPHSEYLDSWSANRLDRTANNVDSPEGAQNAYKMAQQSGFTTAANINYAGITAGTKTLSIFAKAGTFDHIALSYNGVTYFNLTNGTIGTTASGHTAVITDMGNGWYRCAITKTTTAVYTAAYYFAQNNGTLTTTDTQGYMYAYGAMIEAGSYATSYIPTYGSSVTRVDESNSVTGVSDLIGQTEGTLFFDIKDTTNLNGYLGVDSGSSGTRIIMYSLNDGKIYTQVRNGGTIIFSVASSVLNGRAKAAVSFNGSESIFYVNGTQIGSGSGTTYTNLSKVTFNHSSQVGVEINQALVFKTRLSNEELADLTTL